MKFFATIVRYFIAAVLLMTGIGKLLDVPGFMEVIDSYRVLPSPLLPWVAVSMVLIELKLAEILFTKKNVFLPAVFSVLLHSAFTIWAVTALLRGLSIPNCGCFGVFWARPLTWGTVGEDLIMVGLSCVLAYYHKVTK